MHHSRFIGKLGICSATVVCLGLLGCSGPSAQDESTFRDFYSAVDQVWDFMSTSEDAGIQAKLDAAVARVEQAAAGYKAIRPKARKALYERNQAMHDASREKYKKMLNSSRAHYDFMAVNKRMSDILVDALGAKVTNPSSSPLQTSVLYAYQEAYKN